MFYKEFRAKAVKNKRKRKARDKDGNAEKGLYSDKEDKKETTSSVNESSTKTRRF